MSMNQTWVKIPDVLFFQEGPGVRNTQYTTQGVKLLNVANLVDGMIDLSTSDRYISEEEAFGKYKHFLCDVGDFIVASSGIKVEYVDKKMGFIDESMLPLCMNTSTIRFKVLDENRLTIRYFMYYLKSRHFKDQLAHYITGSAQLNYGPSHLSKMKMPLISLSDQQRIVSTLDKLQSIITNRKQQLSKLDELVKARFVEMFGDPEADNCTYPTSKLKELSIKISDGVHAKPEYTDTGRPFLSVVNINRKKVDFTDCKFVSEEAYQKMIKSTHPEKGDVLYTKVGATYGIPAYVDTDIEFCLYVSVCLIKPKHELINSKFLAIQMDMPFVKHQADRRIKGIGVPDLHLNQISEFDIICPPRELQDSFVGFVEQTDKSKVVVQKALDEAQLLFDSLMQEYFG